MFVTVTGLKVAKWYQYPRLWKHTLYCATAAQETPGCLMVETFSVDGFHHTFSAFQDQKSLKTFSRGKAHMKAIKAFRSIAEGKIYGWECETLPTREEALQLWQSNAKWY
uniref:ABM domain-containing protein n=1 Tax=Helicotheca tamesis TaxID=374047 RepID=A0A7S2H0E0_9STRA|mmetsp:Transcript_13995/g.19151  ORF Transcript_13995/g.19151 Transcript_13995/m.19151 type:complete len:110 (+) Transcript_13995:79-408(+)